MTGLDHGPKIAILAGVAAVAIAAALSLPPIAQPTAYHQFADQRDFLGVPNFADVASNIGFLFVGALGLVFLFRGRGRTMFDAPRERLPYVAFFAGIALVSAGSAYYHLAATNETLFWDRLPITFAFMALFSAFIADRVHSRAGVVVMLPLLLALGAGSVVYWYVTEAAGHGDLRPYFLVQFYPMVAIPLICFLFPGRITSGKSVAYLVGWYGLAKVFELFDKEIFALLGFTVSGHTLKHIASTVAAYVVLAMLREAGSANRARAE